METIKTAMSGIVAGADHYLEPGSHLIKLCSDILGEVKYVLTVEKSFAKTDAPTRTMKGTFKPTMLKIALPDKANPLSDADRNEIELKLLFELRDRLGKTDYEQLVISSGMAKDGSYCININRQVLYRLSPQLAMLARQMSCESVGDQIKRESNFEFRKAALAADLEIERATKKIENTELQFGDIPVNNSQAHFALLTMRYTAHKMALSDATARKELLNAMQGDMVATPEIQEDIIQIYLIYMRYREAVFSDAAFQNELFLKYPEKSIEKIMEDPDRRIECFIYYIENNPPYQNMLKTIFNSPDPKINLARFETYKGCSDKIADFSKSEDNIVLSGKIGDAISFCYSYIVSEERKYIESANLLIDASHFLLGYPQLTYEPQFAKFDPETKVVCWPLKSIKLEVALCEHGVIRRAQDFEAYLNQLKNLLGEERYHRLVFPTENPPSADGTMYCVYLNPMELRTITLDDLIPELSPDDQNMYNMMRCEKRKGDDESGKVDKVARMYKDFVVMYEIYAKFKIATSPCYAQVTLISDPDFWVISRQVNQRSQWKDFIQFIKKNNHYLSTIMHIFSDVSLEENRSKCEEYIKQCGTISRFAIGNELKKSWFLSLGQLVTWCADVAEIQHLLNLAFPKFLPLNEFSQKMKVPADVIRLVFEKLFALNLLAFNVAEQSPKKIVLKSTLG